MSTERNPSGNAREADPRATQNPGDDAPRGSPGTGEDVCPVCHGSGKANAGACVNCGGTGRVTKAIGGA